MPESNPLSQSHRSLYSRTERERRDDAVSSGRGAGVGVDMDPSALETSLSRGLELFIDKVANAMQLGVQHRAELHAFKELVAHMPESFHRIAVYQLANTLKAQEQLTNLDQKIDFVKAQMQSVNTQLSKRFMLNAEQQADILATCKAMVVESNRTEYDFANEALERLKDAATFPGLVPAFKSRANTKIVLGQVRRQSSYARTSYRAAVRDSVFNGKKKCGVTHFIHVTVRKFTDSLKIDVQLVLHVLVLRQFVRDNRELVFCEDDEDDGEDGEEDSDGGPKRKRGRTKTPFWGEFMRFIGRKQGNWGDDYRNQDWKSFIESCVHEERLLFPDDLLPDLPHTSSPSRPQTMGTHAPFSFGGDVGTPGREPSPRQVPSMSSPFPPTHPMLPHTPFVDRRLSSTPPSPSVSPPFSLPARPPANFAVNSAPQHSRLPSIAGMTSGAPFRMQDANPPPLQHGSSSVIPQGHSHHSPYPVSYGAQQSLSLATFRDHGRGDDFSAPSGSQHSYNIDSSYTGNRMYIQ